MYVETIELSYTLLQHRRKLATYLRRITHWLKYGTLRVVIFGAGGTGKTTLAEMLEGKIDLRSYSPQYRESPGIDTYRLDGDVPCQLVVGPGQERRVINTWHKLYRSLAIGESRGVINVVSHGYHSFAEIGYKEVREYKPPMTKRQFLAAYTEKKRDRELEIVRSLTPRLVDAKGKIWMITLVTKQDIWWHERAEVREFYMNGEYNECINQVMAQRGQQNFTHEYLSVSLVASNFLSGVGECIAPTARGYDQL